MAGRLTVQRLDTSVLVPPRMSLIATAGMRMYRWHMTGHATRLKTPAGRVLPLLLAAALLFAQVFNVVHASELAGHGPGQECQVCLHADRVTGLVPDASLRIPESATDHHSLPIAPVRPANGLHRILPPTRASPR